MEYNLYHHIHEISGADKTLEQAKADLYALWQDCFGDSNSYTDFYFNWKVKDNQIYSIYNKDKLSSMLHLNPYLLMAHGKKIPANYIVGVATRLEERRKGLMKMLIEASFQQMYREQIPFTYLMPAAESIYLPFGFRIVYEQEPWNQMLGEESKNLKKVDTLISNDFSSKKLCNSVTLIPLEPEYGNKIDELVCFSNQLLSKNYDIYAERNEYYYTRLIHEMKCTGGEVLLCYRQEQLIGYVSYMAEGDIYITEIIGDSRDTHIMIGGVAEYTKNLVNANESEEKKENHIPPTIMTRIVNFQSFVQNITADNPININIEVKDPIIKENNGVYSLDFSTNDCVVTSTNEEPEITADIADLTRLFFHRLPKSELTTMITGMNQEEVRQKLEKIKGYKNVFINEVV